jgi:GNAT superfamily N-acetyltransferase
MPNRAGVFIRPATAADIDAVRGIVGQTWLASYGPIVGPANVADMAAVLLSDISLRQLIADSSSETPLALLNDVPAATAVARLEQDCLHVLRLYVLPAFQGRGLGAALLDWLTARQRAGLTVRLEVVASNDAALRFYAREGFADIGGGREIIGGVPFDIRRLERHGG